MCATMLPKMLRYKVGPPLMVVGVTVGVQVLALYGGGGHTRSWSLVGSVGAWCTVLMLALWALLSLLVPGPEFKGAVPKYGDTPVYSANGVHYYIVSFCSCSAGLMMYPDFAAFVYRSFPQILAVCNIIALSLCFYLLKEGKENPQTDEKLPKRPLVYEFYRGMEVHPRLCGVDVKQLTNCRFGLIAWQMLVLIFFAAGYQRNGYNLAQTVCAILQTVYLAKFYWWETGYFNTLDITLDRAGYYICWGCIVFVPGFYTFTSYYLVSHPPVISNSGAVLCLILGLYSIAINYRIDWEKQYFRVTNGRCYLWHHPAKYIRATYKTNDGKIKTSLLLTSGFWGKARHLNYTFELLIALSWSLTGLGLGIAPFLYVMFLSVLLIHRLYRDEEKCRAKYGEFWDQYCKVVPYRLIPHVF